MTPIDALESRLDQLVGRRSELELEGQREADKISKLRKQAKRIDKAAHIIDLVARATQLQVEELISSLVTESLSVVFPEPMEFRVRYETKRGRPFCSLAIVKHGEELDPMSMMGGSVVDVISFTLRVVLLLLRGDRTRRLLVFDEPFRFVSADLRPQVSHMVHRLAHELGIQMIIITHEPTLASIADAVFSVTKADKVSSVQDANEGNVS